MGVRGGESFWEEVFFEFVRIFVCFTRFFLLFRLARLFPMLPFFTSSWFCLRRRNRNDISIKTCVGVVVYLILSLAVLCPSLSLAFPQSAAQFYFMPIFKGRVASHGFSLEMPHPPRSDSAPLYQHRRPTYSVSALPSSRWGCWDDSSSVEGRHGLIYGGM